MDEGETKEGMYVCTWYARRSNIRCHRVRSEPKLERHDMSHRGFPSDCTGSVRRGMIGKEGRGGEERLVS